MDISKIVAHYEGNWGKGLFIPFPESTQAGLPREFAIMEFPPRASRRMWTYATCGMSLGRPESRVELHVFSDQERRDVSEILAACAHYHLTGRSLGVGHTVNFGRPWAEGSTCDSGLISLPYLDGPVLEKMEENINESVSFLWLIPITRKEVDFKKTHGLDELERLFEDRGFDFSDPMRASVC